MCIANVGLPRPSRGGYKNNEAIDASLFSRLVAKDDFMQMALQLEPTPIAEPSSTLTQELPSQSKPQHVDNSHEQSAHIVVQHNYHDHANDNRADYQEEHPARGGVVTPFPLKLHEMLDAASANNQEDIVSWQPHGRCFVVHKPKEFVNLLPKYFKLSKLPSFQRQLNLYGFQRLTRGRDKGGYYHELFLRDRTFLAHNIQRIKVKGTGVRARSNPDQEPDFWSMEWVGAKSSDDSSSSSESTVPAASPSLASLPLQLQLEQPSMIVAPWKDDASVGEFDSRPFHCLSKTQEQANGMDALLASEADAFFDDFDFPEDIGNEIEDDDVFGDMLEQMIA